MKWFIGFLAVFVDLLWIRASHFNSLIRARSPMWLHILHEIVIHTYHQKCHKHGGLLVLQNKYRCTEPLPFLDQWFLPVDCGCVGIVYVPKWVYQRRRTVGYAKRCTTCSMTAVDKSEWITMFLEKMCVSESSKSSSDIFNDSGNNSLPTQFNPIMSPAGSLHQPTQLYRAVRNFVVSLVMPVMLCFHGIDLNINYCFCIATSVCWFIGLTVYQWLRLSSLLHLRKKCVLGQFILQWPYLLRSFMTQL